MKTIGIEVADDANNSMAHIPTTTKDVNAYYELVTTFSKHRCSNVSVVSSRRCTIPKYWAVHVLSAVKDMLSLNDNIKFMTIIEENAKLRLDFCYPEDYDELIHMRVYRLKNLIDALVHMRIKQTEVARKFHHDTPFY